MTEKSQDSDYFRWLVKTVKGDSHLELLKELYSIDYTPVFEMDKNRVYAGLSLRGYYAYETGIDEDELVLGNCSVLELLIGLAWTIQGIYGNEISKWFWEMADNLGVSRYSDTRFSKRSVDEHISMWLRRQYTREGVGSPFPLRHYDGDTRTIELYLQMNMYMKEKYPVNDWIRN